MLLISKVYGGGSHDGQSAWSGPARLRLGRPRRSPTGRAVRFLNVNSEVADIAKVGPIRARPTRSPGCFALGRRWSTSSPSSRRCRCRRRSTQCARSGMPAGSGRPRGQPGQEPMLDEAARKRCRPVLMPPSGGPSARRTGRGRHPPDRTHGPRPAGVSPRPRGAPRPRGRTSGGDRCPGPARAAPARVAAGVEAGGLRVLARSLTEQGWRDGGARA